LGFTLFRGREMEPRRSVPFLHHLRRPSAQRSGCEHFLMGRSAPDTQRPQPFRPHRTGGSQVSVSATCCRITMPTTTACWGRTTPATSSFLVALVASVACCRSLRALLIAGRSAAPPSHLSTNDQHVQTDQRTSIRSTDGHGRISDVRAIAPGPLLVAPAGRTCPDNSRPGRDMSIVPLLQECNRTPTGVCLHPPARPSNPTFSAQPRAGQASVCAVVCPGQRTPRCMD